LLIRRFGGAAAPGRPACFAIRSGPGEPRIERTALARHDDALELDLQALGRGEPLGLEPHGDALFLVCTHGRHDVCCAERGRPLARALALQQPERAWECSHIGGDRFAPNLLAFPHGIYFGRVEPEDAAAVARAYLDGRLSLPHLRGRTSLPMAAQFAERALREELALDRVDDVVFERATRDAGAIRATFATPLGRHVVTLETSLAPPRRLTCHSAAEEGVRTYRVLEIAPG
jgi:hypothetical protein